MALLETVMVQRAQMRLEVPGNWELDMIYRMTKYWVLASILLSLLPADIYGAKLRLYPDWFMNVEMAGTIAAIEKGWFKKEGIDLEIVFKDLTIIPRIEKNEADIGMDTGHSLIQYIDKGADLKVFSAKYQASPHCIIVPHDSKIMSVADLKGKTLAEYAPQDRAIYQIFLGHAGLTLKRQFGLTKI
jgi:ABC-type nitrate/sulfonate/bicarbonate transport system substrate-binding protein